MRRKLIATAFAAALLSVAPAGALATSTGTPGQPGQDCESLQTFPPGFLTTGFHHATTVYAGAMNSGSLHSGNDHAVSQYDVACFQQFSHGH
jgi:hypothetical protein